MRKEDVEQWIKDNKLENVLCCKHFENLNSWGLFLASVDLLVVHEEDHKYADLSVRFFNDNSLKDIILLTIDAYRKTYDGHTKQTSHKLKLSMLKNIINNIEEE